MIVNAIVCHVCTATMPSHARSSLARMFVDSQPMPSFSPNHGSELANMKLKM